MTRGRDDFAPRRRDRVRSREINILNIITALRSKIFGEIRCQWAFYKHKKADARQGVEIGKRLMESLSGVPSGLLRICKNEKFNNSEGKSHGISVNP